MSLSVLQNKCVVLGVSGGIAAYKACELVRLLQKQGAQVQVMMTRNAQRFVGPATFEALSGHPVCSNLFDRSAGSAIGHIDWAEKADAVVIAPATANIIGKLANGIADDALSTFLMAVRAPVIICPAMNPHMLESRAVQRNLGILRSEGRFIIEPATGEMACGTTGAGRLPEPVDILDRACAFLSPKDLKGKHILVSAGPTREAIDPVRFMSNPASGKMGYAIARAAEHRGARVTLVTGPTALPDPAQVETVHVTSAREMADTIFSRFADSDIIIMSAAVADYRPASPEAHKIKKQEGPVSLLLERTEDILLTLAGRKAHRVLVGFAAETRELEIHAREKLRKKNLDMIVGNLIGQPGSGFAGDSNRVCLLYRDGTQEQLPEMSKDAVADLMLDRIRQQMAGAGETAS